MRSRHTGLAFVFLLAACRARAPAGVLTVPLPDGRPGIGFDDLRFSMVWGVLAPAGRTGNLALIDVQTRAVTTIAGFSEEPLRFAGHDQGATSVDEGGGFFNLNLVLRWEYRLGSTLYLVYTRAQAPDLQLMTGEMARLDLGAIRHGPAADVLLVKLTYWWG
jgi:hypothetical protein